MSFLGTTTNLGYLLVQIFFLERLEPNSSVRFLVKKPSLQRPHRNVIKTINKAAKAAAATIVAALVPIFTTSIAISVAAADTAVTLVETYDEAGPDPIRMK